MDSLSVILHKPQANSLSNPLIAKVWRYLFLHRFQTQTGYPVGKIKGNFHKRLN